MQNATILLVKDNPDDDAPTLRALKSNNVRNKVFVARDGIEALDFLFCTGKYADRDPREIPQFILLNLKLPKVDGLEVLRRLRANERTRLIPAVILASSNEEQDLMEGCQGGTNSYVRKPVNYNRFEDAIHQPGLYGLVLNETPPG